MGKHENSQKVYDRALAEYLRYSHSALERAIAGFERVVELETASEPKPKKSGYLLRLAHARLAQAHAMHEIPRRHVAYDADAVVAHMKQAELHADKATDPHTGGPVTAEQEAELSGLARNAMGLAAMYRSDDPSLTDEQKLNWLSHARGQLEDSASVRPDSWENACDRASVHMRTGTLTGDASEFARAAAHLEHVLTDLRPGYPFARYELGRIHRLTGNFSEAIAAFEAVLAVPESERDVSDRRVRRELDRARVANREFGLPRRRPSP